MGSWQLLVDGQDSAVAQMAIDEDLAMRSRPTFRLFRWRAPALSLGYRQRPPEWVNASVLSAEGAELVERPTGGGLAVHGSDLSCSVTIPSNLSLSIRQLMRVVGESMTRVCRSFGVSANWLGEANHPKPIVYCFLEPSPFTLMVGSRKLCGFAIRRYQSSWLIQGSLLIRYLPEVFGRLMPQEVHEAYQAKAIALEEAVGTVVSDAELIARVIQAWRTTWGIPCFWIRWPGRIDSTQEKDGCGKGTTTFSLPAGEAW